MCSELVWLLVLMVSSVACFFCWSVSPGVLVYYAGLAFSGSAVGRWCFGDVLAASALVLRRVCVSVWLQLISPVGSPSNRGSRAGALWCFMFAPCGGVSRLPLCSDVCCRRVVVYFRPTWDFVCGLLARVSWLVRAAFCLIVAGSAPWVRSCTLVVFLLR